MSSKDDIESQEKKPLLAKDDEISGLDDIGEVDTSAHFKAALQRAARLALMMTLVACIVWVPAIRKPFPNQIQARIPLVICLLCCTANPIFGTSIQGGLTGVLGTFWACLHMWVMNGIFPGGMKEGMSPTCATAIFGWVNMLVFLWVMLWCNCGMGCRMFAMSTDIGFMLAFLDPKSTLAFSENFTISHKGTAVNTLLATMIACIGAPLFNLLPYPMTMAFSDMKDKATTTSKDSAKLFESIAMYFCGREASVTIEADIKHSVGLRAEIDGMGGSIGAAWWEGFDGGSRGTVRALMEAHLTLMNDVYDRLAAVLVAVTSEDFADSHIKVADAIRGSTRKVMRSTTKLLITVTDAASDGDISSSEKTELLRLVKDAKDAVKQLAKDFDAVRRTLNKPINEELLSECFFVVTISAYSRLVWEYCEMMCSNPPKGSGVCDGVMAGIKSTWDMSAMTESFHMNFAIKHFLAIVFCWFYSVYVDGFGGGCVITSVFLMNPGVNPNIQNLLNVLNAVIVGVVVGALVFEVACGTGHGDMAVPISAYVIWNVALYGFFSGGPLALPALLVAALTPFKWVASCPTGDISAGARGLWAGMVANVMAILFVSTFQYFLAPGTASKLAVGSLDDAFTDMKKSFAAFWAGKDAKEPMGSVAGSLGSGEGFNASAIIEPRFWRVAWKGALYADVVAQVKQLRLDILMMSYAMEGSDGNCETVNVLAKCRHAPEFKEVQDDLDQTLDDAHRLVIEILSHESGHFDGLSKMKTVSGIDTLEALPGLIASVSKDGMAFPSKVGDSLEDDELCMISCVFLMLDATIKHIAALLRGTIRNA